MPEDMQERSGGGNGRTPDRRTDLERNPNNISLTSSELRGMFEVLKDGLSRKTDSEVNGSVVVSEDGVKELQDARSGLKKLVANLGESFSPAVALSVGLEDLVPDETLDEIAGNENSPLRGHAQFFRQRRQDAKPPQERG